MVQHVIHGNGKGGCVAEHVVAHGVAYEEDVYSSLVKQSRGRLVIACNHDNLLAELFPAPDYGDCYLPG